MLKWFVMMMCVATVGYGEVDDEFVGLGKEFDRNFVAVPTVMDGVCSYEGGCLTGGSEEDVAERVRGYFKKHGVKCEEKVLRGDHEKLGELLGGEVDRPDGIQRGLRVIRGKVDGEMKSVRMGRVGKKEEVAVYLSSEENDPNQEVFGGGVGELYPELMDLGGKVRMSFERMHGMGKSGVFEYGFYGKKDDAVDQVCGRLEKNGWKRMGDSSMLVNGRHVVLVSSGVDREEEEPVWVRLTVIPQRGENDVKSKELSR